MASRKKRTRVEAQPEAPPTKHTAGSQKRVKSDDLFDKYRAISEFPDNEEIGPAGVMEFCKDLQIRPEDVISLIIAWHFDAKRNGYFSKQEFTSGLKKLGCTDLKQLRSKLKSIEQEVMNDPKKFEELYKFAFWFSRDSEKTKVVDRSTAADMIELLLGTRPHTAQFVKWLRTAPEAKQYNVLNSDQWLCFLDFSKNVQQDFSNFDESSAWPLILDEFAKWSKDQLEMKIDGQ